MMVMMMVMVSVMDDHLEVIVTVCDSCSCGDYDIVR